MKYTQLSAYEKHLKSASPAHLAPVYLLLGKDSFLSKQAADAASKAILSDPTQAVRLEGPNIEARAVLNEINSISFLSPRTLVVVNMADKLLESQAPELIKYLNKPAKDSFLIFIAEQLNANTKIYKAIEKAGVILRPNEEKEWEKTKNAIPWLMQRIALSHKTLASSAAEMLVKQLGSDKTFLQNELDKLVCYTGDRSMITKEDVLNLSYAVNVETVWRLGEAVMARDSKTALHVIKGLLDDEVNPISIIKMLRKQLETGYQVCSIIASGAHPHDVTAVFPYMKGWLLDKKINEAKSYGLDRFKKAIIQVDETELSLKSGGDDPSMHLELLLTHVVQ
jgi:DNA polymerase-3 subunit delta